MKLGVYLAIFSILFLSSFYVFGKDTIFINNLSLLDSNSSFLDLNDTPNSYLGQSSKLVRVNATEDGLEFVSPSVNSGDTNCSTSADCNSMYIRKNPIGSETIFHENGEQLIISQDGNVSNSTSVGGAILLDNTDNNGAGLIIYSNIGTPANGRLLNIRADNNGYDQAVVHIDNDGTANALEVVQSGQDSTAQAFNVVSTNYQDSAFTVTSNATGKGVAKIVHDGNSLTPNASGISIDLQGNGTAAQGLYVDSTATSGTTGDLLRLRNRSIDQFVVDKNGNASSIADINGFRLCIQDDCRTTWPTGGGSTDGNGSILGTTNQVSVTNGLSRLFGDANVVLSLPQNIDGSAQPQFIGLTLSPCTNFQMDTSPQLRFKVDCSSSLITATSQIPTQPGITDIGNSSNRYDDFWITDINATGTNDFKTICIGGDCKTSWPTSVSSDTNCSTSPDCNSLYIQKNPLADQNINNFDLNIYDGQLVIQAGDKIASSSDNAFEIWNQDGTRVVRIDQNGNLVLDGNITFVDANSYIGGVGSVQGRRVRVNALDYTGNASTGGTNLWISANTYAFAVTNTLTSGLYYSASAPRGFHWQIDGSNKFLIGAGATGTEGAIWQLIRTANPSGGGTTQEGWTFLKDIGLVDYNAQPYTYRQGVYQHLNSRMYLGTPNDLVFDGNWTGDINAHGDYRVDGNVVVDKNIYGQLITPGNIVGTSCNTTCGAISYAGPWACVEADNITGAASTCTDTTVAHNCVCRN